MTCFADQARILVTDAEVRDELGRNGLRYVAENHNPQVILAAWETVLDLVP